METDMSNTTAPLRKRFFALRNGVIADILRKGGLRHKYIFGLQLPQLKQLCDEFRPDDDVQSAALARTLWADRECREARLLACYMMPPGAIDTQEALAWAGDASGREESDILAFRLLRHHREAAAIERALAASTDEGEQYTAEALRRFL